MEFVLLVVAVVGGAAEMPRKVGCLGDRIIDALGDECRASDSGVVMRTLRKLS